MSKKSSCVLFLKWISNRAVVERGWGAWLASQVILSRFSNHVVLLFKHRAFFKVSHSASTMWQWYPKEDTNVQKNCINGKNSISRSLRSIRYEETVEKVKSLVRTPHYLTEKRPSFWCQKLTLHLIVKKDLYLKIFNLHESNEMLRRFLNIINILCSDATNFHLKRIVNKQKCGYWSEQNPKQKISATAS